MNDKTFTLNFTAQDVDIIASALNELPIKVGLATLQRLIQQVQDANAEKEVSE